jgi:hypothetical protein
MLRVGNGAYVETVLEQELELDCYLIFYTLKLVKFSTRSAEVCNLQVCNLQL